MTVLKPNNRTASGPISAAVQVDYRERNAELPRLLRIAGFEVVTKHLPLCDYAIDQTIYIERKTGHDLAISIIDGRLFRQASRMKKSSSRCLFLIEGSPFDTNIDISPEAIKGALLSLQAIWYIPVIYAADSGQACLIFAMLSKQWQRLSPLVDLRHGYRPKKLITRKHYVIQGLPRVGPMLAKRLLDHFSTVKNIMNASEAELTQVEGIGQIKAQMIRDVLS
jgi:Fanconi anemia group M protein